MEKELGAEVKCVDCGEKLVIQFVSADLQKCEFNVLAECSFCKKRHVLSLSLSDFISINKAYLGGCDEPKKN